MKLTRKELPFEERYGKCQDKAGSSVMVKLLEDESDATYMIKTTKKNM